MPQISSTMAETSRGPAIARLILYSLFGLFVFFVPFELAGRSTIALDHAATAVVTHARPLAVTFVCLLILYGAVAPLRDGSWRRSTTTTVFTGLKLLGVLLTALYLAGIGPAALFAPDMLPFLFDKLVLSVGLIVPIGALALGFLVGFGLLELTGVLVDRIMRPVWRTPGWSAMDAVASFVGSYSLALLIADRVFREGKYTVREAAIIATGYSTVSATFMIIVAKTLGLMAVWNLYFWTTLVVISRSRQSLPVSPAQGSRHGYQIRGGRGLGEPNTVLLGLGALHPRDIDPAGRARPAGHLVPSHGAQHPADRTHVWLVF
jgi:nucleoside recognition membrane protein YjiH